MAENVSETRRYSSLDERIKEIKILNKYDIIYKRIAAGVKDILFPPACPICSIPGLLLITGR